jgi:anti-anti-sigma regulatory factor
MNETLELIRKLKATKKLNAIIFDFSLVARVDFTGTEVGCLARLGLCTDPWQAFEHFIDDIVEKEGLKVYAVNMSKQVRTTFERTKLKTLLTSASSLGEAFKAVNIKDEAGDALAIDLFPAVVNQGSEVHLLLDNVHEVTSRNVSHV